MNTWQATTLGAVCSLITDGKHGDCTDEENSNYYFISAKDIRDGIINYENSRQISEKDFAETHRRTDLKPGNLLVTNSGTIGRLAIAQDDQRTFRTTFQKSVAILKPKSCTISSRFLYYYLAANMKTFIHPAAGAAQKNLLLRDIRAFRIFKPSLHEQDNISSMLSNYDFLIENNRQRIALLEEAARLLFREWFIHFRFPGHQRVKIIDDLPEGWNRLRLGDIATIKKGKNITRNMVEHGAIPVVAGGLRPAYYHSRANAFGPVVTVSASGANAGYVNLYHEDIWASDCSYLSVTDNPEIWFTYLSMKSRQVEITGMQQGAAQPHVYPKHLERLSVVFAPANLRKLFHGNVDTSFRQIANLEKQAEALAQARDLLLPRLMSGEIAV